MTEVAAERYGHASGAWFLDFLEGSDASPEGLDSLAVEIEDPVRRARAMAGSAIMRAYLAAVHGRDWVAPMATPYPMIADLMTDDWRASIVVRTWTMTMAITAALVGVAMLVAGWMGILRV